MTSSGLTFSLQHNTWKQRVAMERHHALNPNMEKAPGSKLRGSTKEYLHDTEKYLETLHDKQLNQFRAQHPLQYSGYALNQQQQSFNKTFTQGFNSQVNRESSFNGFKKQRGSNSIIEKNNALASAAVIAKQRKVSNESESCQKLRKEYRRLREANRIIQAETQQIRGESSGKHKRYQSMNATGDSIKLFSIDKSQDGLFNNTSRQRNNSLAHGGAAQMNNRNQSQPRDQRGNEELSNKLSSIFTPKPRDVMKSEQQGLLMSKSNNGKPNQMLTSFGHTKDSAYMNQKPNIFKSNTLANTLKMPAPNHNQLTSTSFVPLAPNYISKTHIAGLTSPGRAPPQIMPQPQKKRLATETFLDSVINKY